MASFRQHITFGALIGIIGTTLLYFYALVTDPYLLIILFVATTVASFLPDLDSDSGVPFYLVFGTFTLACAGVSLYYMLLEYPGQLLYILGAPIGVIVFVWFVVGTLLKKCTHHRGMMHSIPAMAIAALLTFLLVRYLHQGDMVAIILAAAVAAGFASHLALDEVQSELNMNGMPFVTRHSLGTAMKLFSPSKRVTIFTYVLLAFLLYEVFYR